MRTVLMLVTATCLLLFSLACGGLGIGGCPEQEEAFDTWGTLAEEMPQGLPVGGLDTGTPDFNSPGVIALYAAAAIKNGNWEDAIHYANRPDPRPWSEPWRSRWTDARDELWAARRACDPTYDPDTSSPP